MGVRSGTTKKTFAVNKNRLLWTTVYRELLTKPHPKWFCEMGDNPSCNASRQEILQVSHNAARREISQEFSWEISLHDWIYILSAGTNLYFKYKFVLHTPATAAWLTQTNKGDMCVDLLTGGESLCHDWVSTQRPVLSPHLEAALNKIKVLPHVK